MYEIERTDDRVLIRVGSRPVYAGAIESFLLFREGAPGTQAFVRVAKVKTMTDEALLLALANVVELKDVAK